ncbi:MAG: hypothetical protein U0V54_06820 [Saprospiraceae bacterium]|nr:hypothetical protein [Saprospiraceae bacterium]
MKTHFPIILFALFISSCQGIDDEVLPIFGVYDAHVVGISGPYSINISAAGGDDILIDAPFDGEDWYVVRADIDESSQAKWKIDINRQQLSPGVEIWGEGFYYRDVVQLDYTVQYFGQNFDFRMIAEK